VPGEVVGSGEEDLRCRSLLTVCQRRLGLSEAEDTRLEKYSFLEDRMSLWYWLRRDLKEDQSAVVDSKRKEACLHKTKQKTRTIRSTLNPEWNQTFSLCVHSRILSASSICVRCKTLYIIGGQHDGLCPFWQPARSIFTVLLCCVFFKQINSLSLSLHI